ncbi:MAG: penicillin-binding protein 1C [Acidobacteriota bacterium]
MTRQRTRRIFTISIPAALLIAAAAWIRCGPLPPGLLGSTRNASTRIVDRNGVVLYETLSAAETRSAHLDESTLPQALVEATIAAEDRRFFHHPGIDPIATARALAHDVRAGRFVEGGSTITQQVVKQLVPRDRSLRSKLREAVLALRLEHHLSKRQILALYLNLAPYGNQYVGAQRASRGYFSVPAENLTVAQAAFLAGLPQRPGRFDPRRNLPAAMARKESVLARMNAAGLLSREEWRIARSEQLRFVADERPIVAQHFVEHVLNEVAGITDGKILIVNTTLDAELQKSVHAILQMQQQNLEKHGANNVAVVVMDNRSGEWLAWEGSGDYFDAAGGAIDGVTTPRQPGSALKPFTYALAFENGFTPASVLPDIPSNFPTAEQGILYSPRNYDGAFRGPLRARAALAGSENVPAVWLLSQLQVPSLLRFLHQAGFTTFRKNSDYYGLGLTLGDAEVRLDEMVSAYSVFARGGAIVRPSAIRSVLFADGRENSPSRPPPERILSQRTAFWITDILSDSEARAFVFGQGGSLDLPFPVAVKTGTSQAYHDNWTIGYSREVTVGVWVGNFDRTGLRNSSGVTGAAPIFHAVMLAAEKSVLGRLPGPGDAPIADRPDSLTLQSVCALSGLRPSLNCPAVETEWLPGDSPPHDCDWHNTSQADVRWPAEYRSWALKSGLTAPIEAASKDSPPGDVARSRPLRIASPPDGATYMIDPTLRQDFQSVPLRAVAAQAGSRITWRVNGNLVGIATADRALRWPLRPGRHTIVARDEEGRTDSSMIYVK